MNLNIYEKVEINRTKTWVDPKYKKLYSRELDLYPLFTILKRYNPTDKCIDYFLCLTREGDSEHKWDCVTRTKTGITKINLSSCWHLLPFKDRLTEFEIIIEEVDRDETGVVYYLDI